MKKRSLWFVGGISILTLGLYYYYWMYITYKEMNEKHDQEIPPFFFYVSFFVPVIGILPVAFLHEGDVGALFWIIIIPMLIVTLIVSFWWLWQYCKAVDNVTGNKISAVVTFIVFLFADEFAPIIIQHYFNKTSR